MITVRFYRNSAENNRVDKSATNKATETPYLEHLFDYNCLWKEETSYMNPVLEINYPIRIINYVNYCEFNDRYYYVVDIVSVRNSYWRLYLKLDVLMTYKEFIINSLPCIVDRNEFAFNKWLNDPMIPFTENVNLISTKVKKLFETDRLYTYDRYCDFCYVITVLNGNTPREITDMTRGDDYGISYPIMGNKYGIGSEATYIVTLLRNDVKYNGVFAIMSNIQDIRNSILKSSQVQSYVLNITAYPFDILRNMSNMSITYDPNDEAGEHGTVIIQDTLRRFVYERIFLGDRTAAEYNYGLKVNPNATFKFSVSFSFSELQFNNNFMDFEPYTKRILYLPYYGSYNINVKDIIPYITRGYTGISIEYVLDIQSGNCTIFIFITPLSKDIKTIILDTLNINLGCDISINSTTADKVARQKLVNSMYYINAKNTASNNAAIGAIKVTTGAVNGAVSSLLTPSPVQTLGGLFTTISDTAAGAASTGINYDTEMKTAKTNYYAAEAVNIPYGLKASKSNDDSINFYLNQPNVTLYIYKNDIISDNPDLRYHTYGRSLNAAVENLSAMWGYTVLSDFHLDGLVAYENEKAELASLLMGGIILPDPPST